MYEKDYIMRLIHEMVRTLVKLLFNIDMDKNEDVIFDDVELEMKYNRLLNLVKEGHINEAENRLLDDLNTKNLQDFKLALKFYEFLNEKEDDFLEENDFSRKEVSDGIKYVASLYGYGSMIEALLGSMPE